MDPVLGSSSRLLRGGVRVFCGFQDVALAPTAAEPISASGSTAESSIPPPRASRHLAVCAFVDRRRPTRSDQRAYVGSADELTAFYGGGDEIHLPFNFFLAQVPRRDAAALRDVVERVERACNGRWPSNVFSNHDIDRACDRFAAGADPDAVARLLAMLLLTLRGTPFIYYGENRTRTNSGERMMVVMNLRDRVS